MKKVLFLSILLTFAVCVSVSAVNAEITTAVNNAEVAPGETVTITMELAENPGIGMMVISPIYDESVLSLATKDVVNGEVFDDISVMNVTNITFMDTNALSLVGTVATFTFTVNDKAAGGNTTVEFIVNEVYDQDYGDSVKLNIQSATVTIKQDTPSVGETMTGYSLTLQGGGQGGVQGDIGVNIGMTMTEDLRNDEDAYLSVTVNGKNEKVSVSSLSFDQDGKTTYTVYTAAKNMGDEISVIVYSGSGECGATYTCSVQSYAEYILENSTKYDDTLVSLVKAMLNYGAAAQNYFGYDTDSPVNNAMTETDKNAVESCTEIGADADRTVNTAGSYTDTGISNHTANLVLGSQTTIRHYITLASGTEITDLTFKVGEKDITPVKDGDRYALDITEIPAAMLDNGYIITVANANGNSYNVTYSALNYLSRMFDSNKDDNEKTSYVDLLKAMYLYNQAADIHFSN